MPARHFRGSQNHTAGNPRRLQRQEGAKDCAFPSPPRVGKCLGILALALHLWSAHPIVLASTLALPPRDTFSNSLLLPELSTLPLVPAIPLFGRREKRQGSHRRDCARREKEVQQAITDFF